MGAANSVASLDAAAFPSLFYRCSGMDLCAGCYQRDVLVGKRGQKLVARACLAVYFECKPQQHAPTAAG
jgi:hypothetical protein